MAISITGLSAFQSEALLTYELGYRVVLSKALSLDVTAFYNNYDSLLGLQQSTLPSVSENSINQTLLFGNHVDAEAYGFEMTSVWQMKDWWQWNFNYSFAKYQIHNKGITSAQVYESQQMVSVCSEFSPWNNVKLDLWFRYIDPARVFSFSDNATVPGYASFDMRFAWKPKDNFEISITGQNLSDSSHLEYVQEYVTLPTEVKRGVYGKFSFNF